jgi:membrane protein YdbS with pleckstrin-like domain
MNDAFAPPGESWVGVSVRLRAMRRAVVGFLCALAVLGIGIGFSVAGSVLGAITGSFGVAAFAVAAFVLIGRNYESWGYAERAEDLLVTHGVMFRRLVVVPYGRMQLVDVSAGPIERKFGISTLRLHTAAAGTDARIHGLTPLDATRLRDRLAALGESQSAGL